MKSSILILIVIIVYSFNQKETKKKTQVDQRISTTIKKNFKRFNTFENDPKQAQYRIKKIENLIKRYKDGHSEKFIESFKEIHKEIEMNNSKSRNLDFIDLFSEYLKVNKEYILENPSLIFKEINFNHKFYKEYFLSLRYALGRDFSVEATSTILNQAIEEQS